MFWYSEPQLGGRPETREQVDMRALVFCSAQQIWDAESRTWRHRVLWCLSPKKVLGNRNQVQDVESLENLGNVQRSTMASTDLPARPAEDAHSS